MAIADVLPLMQRDGIYLYRLTHEGVERQGINAGCTRWDVTLQRWNAEHGAVVGDFFMPVFVPDSSTPDAVTVLLLALDYAASVEDVAYQGWLEDYWQEEEGEQSRDAYVYASQVASDLRFFLDDDARYTEYQDARGAE